LEQALTGEHTAGATISARHAGLQGMGGVGKTALATVLAHRLAARYPDGQLFLNLRGADPDRRAPVTPAEAMQSVIHCFHPEARLPEALDELTPIYRSVLAEAGRVLLLLDNAADAAQVKPLLPPPNCLLLVTSRAQFSLPGLATRNLDCLRPEKSRELLLQLAPRLRGLEKEAAELCGHLPLALEVFAGAVNDKRLTPVNELVERLRARLEKLAPVDAAFQVSCELLDEELRRKWTLLAVFPASFDLRAVAAVWEAVAAAEVVAAVYDRREGGSADAGDSAVTDRRYSEARDAMQALVNASLVEWNESNARFRLHDLVRQFCDGRLTDAERDDARLRHARHFRDVGAEAAQLYLKGGEDTLRGLELFDRERAQIEAGFEWLQSRHDHESAALLVSLVGVAVYACDLRFHPRQRIRWQEARRNTARLIGNCEAEGIALSYLGIAYADMGDARKAIEFYEQALVIRRKIGNRRGEGNDLGNLGLAYWNLGDARKAIEFFEEVLAISREIGDRRIEGNTLGNIGNAYAALGDTHRAVEFHEQDLVISREIGDKRIEGNALGDLAIAYKKLGDTDKAMVFCEQWLVIAQEIGDRRGEGNALGNLGIAYADLGDARKAIEFYEQALIVRREIGDQRGEGDDLWNSALAFDKLGDRAQAVARAEAALRIREAIEDPHVAEVRAKLAEWRGEHRE
jgi:tetratricopeptide (TPR) repeat protein